MVDPESRANQVSLRQDPLVEHLIADPNEPADFLTETGYLGRSSRAGYWRLYQSPDMKEYLEFPESDVLHTQALDPHESTLGGTVVWLRRSHELTYAYSDPIQVQASFLSGSIMQLWLPKVGVQRLAPYRPRPGSPGFRCAVSNLLGCASHAQGCPTYQRGQSRTSCCTCPTRIN